MSMVEANGLAGIGDRLGQVLLQDVTDAAVMIGIGKSGLEPDCFGAVDYGTVGVALLKEVPSGSALGTSMSLRTLSTASDPTSAIDSWNKTTCLLHVIPVLIAETLQQVLFFLSSAND